MAIIQNLEAFVQSYPAGLDSVTDLQLSQNENGRQIRFTIGGVTIPAGSVATISGTKPDGVVYSNTGTIEGADTVIFDEDVQMTAVFGTWYAKIRITNAGNTIASARVRFIIDKDPVDAGAIPSESQLDGLVAEAEEYAEAAEDAAGRAAITYGSPLTASTAAAMTDVNRVYVYTGSESGYTYGNWYYYNGSAWVSGGIYNSAAVETDTTLTESGVPADAKATGDKIAELKDDLGDVILSNALFDDNCTITGSTAYESRTVFETHDVQKGVKYTVTIKEVNGSTASSAYGYLQAFNSNNEMVAQGGISINAPIKGTLVIPNTAESLKLVLVASSGTVMPTGTAKFIGVKLYPGDSIEYSYNDGYAYKRVENIESILDITATSNIFDGKFYNAYLDVASGAFIKISSGVTYAAEDDYIPVDSGDTYAIVFDTIAEYIGLFVFEYDSNKDFIKYTRYNTRGALYITPPTGTAYIRLQTNLYNISFENICPTYLSITKGMVIPKRSNARILGQYATKYGDVEEEIIRSSNNIFTGRFVKAAIDQSGNFVVYEDNATSYCAEIEYIPTESDTDYNVRFDVKDVINCNLYVHEYDDSGVNLRNQTFSNIKGISQITFSTGTSTKYIRFHLYSTGVTFEKLVPHNFAVYKTKASRNYIHNYSLSPYAIDTRLLSDVASDAVVPSYYHNDGYLDDKVSTIKNLIQNCSANGDVFFFITDTHWLENAQNSPALIKYLSQEVNIPRLFSGGDMGESGDYRFADRIKRSYKYETHYVMGNHDMRSPVDDLYYAYDLLNNNQIGNPARHYYYVDNIQQKIRYIILSAYDTNESVGYESAQLTWLTTEALNVNDGWTIIVFTHTTYFIDYSSDVLTRIIPQNYLDALDNYDGRGTIACIISGHTHRDRITSTNGGIPIVITTCDKYTPYVSGSSKDLNVERTFGTISEQAFDVVVLDKTSKKLTFIRIGAEALDGIGDNPGQPVQYREVHY